MRPNEPIQSHGHVKWILICLCIFLVGCSKTELVVVNETKITIEVTDDLNHPYPDVVLHVMQDDAVQQNAQSDELGQYTFSDLTEGLYELKAKTPLASELRPGDSKVMSIDLNAHEFIQFTVEPKLIQARLVLGESDLINELTNHLGELPTSDSTSLYHRNWYDEPLGALHPVLAPDREHLTLEDWKTARGTVRAYCDGQHTHYEFEFEGLLDNGIYSLWISPLSEAQSWNDFSRDEIDGIGAIGDADQNSFAFIRGTESIQKKIKMRRGSLSMQGVISGCTLSSEEGLLIILNYHMDKHTHGDDIGPDKYSVTQLMFLI